MMISDISGISDIRLSIADRGTSVTHVLLTARIGIDHAPPLSCEISPMNWLGPRVDRTLVFQMCLALPKPFDHSRRGSSGVWEALTGR
jgi:hypothetical protein